MDLDYHGGEVRAFAVPMDQVPWTLVTFMDDEIVDTVLLESLITAAALVICYAFAIMLAFWVYARVFDRSSAHRSLQWLWPNPDHARQYPIMLAAVLLLSVLFIVLSVTDAVSDSVIHQLFFLTPLLALLMARFVFNPDLRDFSHRAGALLIVLVMVLFFMLNHAQAGAWLWGMVVLSLLVLFGFASYRTLLRARAELLASHGAVKMRTLPHLRSMLPLVAVLVYTGPVAGVIIYLPTIESFGTSYTHYSDDQMMRALEIGEADYRRVTRRYFDAGNAGGHHGLVRFQPGTAEAPADCLGTYVHSGPFIAKPYADEVSRDDGSINYSRQCRWHTPTEQVLADCKHRDVKRVLNENWVSWFVLQLPAFSYESGALKQAAHEQRDSGRLQWCTVAGSDHPRQFIGRFQSRPAFALQMDASDFSFAYTSRQDLDPGLKVVDADQVRLSVISSILFIAMLIGTFLYAIARSITHHLFGANLSNVEFDMLTVAQLATHPAHDHVLLSPVSILADVREVFPQARVFSPHCWRTFCGSAPGEASATLQADDVLVVDETETAFYIAEQRQVLLRLLEQALAAGTRIILLTRVDPVHWLDTLDARSLAESETLPISQEEIIVWSSLMRKFRISLVPSAHAWARFTQAQAHHEHMRNWAVSTRHERNVLANLALSDLYNPRNSDEIFHLVRRGLVSPQPPYELPNASFKTFILRSPELDPLKGWRKEGVGSLWTALWPTLLVIIGLLMFFVVSSGQNTVKTAAALLASVVAALPVLMSVFAFARNNSRG
jgi:hypothetical protein